MGWEQVVHDDEMNLSPVRNLNSVETIELTEKCVGIFLNVGIIVSENFAKKFVFGVMNGLDDVFVVAREIEETARFARGTEFGQDVFRSERNEIVSGIQTKVVAKVAEDPGSVVLELEVVLGRWCEFVTGDIE